MAVSFHRCMRHCINGILTPTGNLGKDGISFAEMERATQQNAATAEESASASAELNAQAETLKVAVRDLSAVVKGNREAVTGIPQ